MTVKHRNRNPQGQQQRLSERLSAHQAAMREDRRQWRSGLAQQLGRINFGLAQFFQRGFFGRLKWLVTGR
jgi:hypothetical protein